MPGNKPGRPRSVDAREAILRSALELLSSGGYEKLTIDAIATAAGVSRPTLYRWWSGKAELVAEAVLAQPADTRIATPPDTGDIEADLRQWLSEQLARLTDSASVARVRGMAAAVAESHVQGSRLYEQLTNPQRQALLDRMATAVEQGQIRAEVDTATVVDALLGTLLYRSLTRHGQPTAAGPDLVAMLLRGIGPHPL